MTGSRIPPEPASERVRAMARRGLRKVKALDSAVSRLRTDRARAERLETMFDRLAASYVPEGFGSADPIAAVAAVEAAVLTNSAYSSFFRIASFDGNLTRASITVVRELLAAGSTLRARSFSQTLQRIPDLAAVGDLCMILVAIHDPMPETAWALIARNDIAFILRYEPAAYFRLAFEVDPVTGADVLRRLLAGTWRVSLAPAPCVDIARCCLAAGEFTLCEQVLQRIEKALPSVADERRRATLRSDVDWLRAWLVRHDAAAEQIARPAGEIPFAVLDYKQPDDLATSVNLGDSVQTLASLGHLVRRRALSFTGEPELVAVTKVLAGRVKAERRIDAEPATVRLYRADRDATSFTAVPDGTWMLAFGWYMHPIFELRYDFPFNPRLRPIFVSFHLSDIAMLSDDAVDYLRRYSPIGCRDWTTVAILQAAGVPAFFSGCLTTTIDTVFPGDPAASARGTVYVDSPVAERTGSAAADDSFRSADPDPDDADSDGSAGRVDIDEVAESGHGAVGVFARGLHDNLLEALERVGSYRDTYTHVVTSRLHCYLPTRAIGGNVDFKPTNPADPRFDGLAYIDDAEFEALRHGLLDKVAAVLDAITQGRSEDEVYRIWSEMCAPDVALADARRAAVPPVQASSFDIAQACHQVRGARVTVERSSPAPDGPELNIEFSLDGNLKRQMGIVLDSIVAKASRPIRLFVLCRDHGPTDFARMAREFPTVSFVWLPTDDVDYGQILGMIKHITVATMDRLLLPELLPEVARIVHHDLDALCLADLAPLYDLDLGGAPLAARDQPHPNGGSGYRSMLRAARRLRTQEGMAAEVIQQITARHPFDFEVFNAGIMLLDLDRMRCDDFCRQFLPWAERYGFNDQEVLNAYAGTTHKTMDRSWNAYPRLELAENAKILHWLGALKPWSRPYVAGRGRWRRQEAAYLARVKLSAQSE